MALVTLVNHNVTSGFLPSLTQGCFVYLYTCDIVVGQCHNVTNHNVTQVLSVALHHHFPYNKIKTILFS